MIEHLTKNQVEDYCRRRLRPVELVSSSDHLGQCETCRRQVDEFMNADSAFLEIRSTLFGEPAEDYTQSLMPTHLTTEQVAGFIDETLSADDSLIVSDHLTRCDRCTLAVDDLRAFKKQFAGSLHDEYRPASVQPSSSRKPRFKLDGLRSFFRRSPALAFGVSLALLLLVATSWFLWNAAKNERNPKPEIAVAPDAQPKFTPSPPVQPQAQIVARLTDGSGEIILDKEGKLLGEDELPPAYRNLLKETLTSPRLEPSALTKGLTRPSSPLMGGEHESNGFSVIEPVGKVMITDRPTFRWSRLQGATNYVVEIYDAKFNLVKASPEINGDSWTLEEQSLTRGEVYEWQVKAKKDEQEFKAPRPPAPQARFRILDQAKATEIAKAKRAYGSSHLLLGLLYAQAGLINESEQELRALQKANPDSEIARRLLSQAQALRR